MCLCSKKTRRQQKYNPQSETQQNDQVPQPVCNIQQNIKVQEEEIVQVQHEEEPEAVSQVDSMLDQIKSPRSLQQKIFADKVQAFKEKYILLQKESLEIQYNQKPIDQLKASLLLEQLTQLQFPNDEILGPKFLDDNISSYKERGLEFAQLLREYDGDIKIIRLIRQTPYNSQSFFGYLKDKGIYFIKCYNGVNLKKFDSFLNNLSKQIKIGEYFKKYHAYKLESIRDYDDQNNPIGKVYLISTLEDHNLYSFAASTKFSIDQKLQVAHQILNYIDQTKQNSSGTNNQYFTKQIKFISPSNILISIQQNKIDVKISDWQQQTQEFHDIVPDISIKNQSYYSCMDEPNEQRTYFIKLLLLLFFRVNLNQIESFGNLDGTNQIARYLDINLIHSDSNFYKQSGFNLYIQSKINLIASPNQERFLKLWEEMKNKQIQELSYYKQDQMEY